MSLTLPFFMWSLGATTVLIGFLLLRQHPGFATWLQSMPRSERWAYVLFGSGLVWFLWHVLHLGEADFGAYRHWLFALFLAAGIGAFRYVPDFLAVRGLAVLVLLASNEFLQAAYLREPVARLSMVLWVYILIVGAIVVGASPYRFHRWVQRLLTHSSFRNWTAFAFLTIGGIVFVSGFACLGSA